MGEYFITVNPAKRQYLSHHRLPFNSRFNGLLSATQGLTLGLLVSDIAPQHREHPLIGYWAGDTVIVTGDDHGRPDVAGLKTTTADDSKRNLYWMANDEFEDITFKAIGMLCAFDPVMADRLALLVNRHQHEVDAQTLSVLTELAVTTDCEHLRLALQRALVRGYEDQRAQWNDETISEPEFVVVNLKRRQYIDPASIKLRARNFRILEGATRLLQGASAFAVGLLIADTVSRQKGHEGFFQEWLGDPVMVAYRDSAPNPSGITTTSGASPNRNLYQMAQEEFEDFTGRAIVTLMRHDRWVADQPRITAPTI